MKIDGIQIQRDKNDGINDIVKGVSIDLKRKTKFPVEINITNDLDKAIEKVKKFVESYNKFIDYHRSLVKSDRVNKPGGHYRSKNGRQKRRKNGLFVGDMSMISLESRIKRTVNNAYPNMADKPIKIMAQLGVSTGKVNSVWDKIKAGKLVIDETLLKKKIVDNPEGVRMFFGSDSDGDKRPDTGMAYTLVNNLRPYISSGKNIIATKIDSENTSIKMASDRIERKEMHIKRKEESLRKKFGAMERAISGTNSTKNWMKQQFGGGGGGGKYSK